MLLLLRRGALVVLALLLGCIVGIALGRIVGIVMVLGLLVLLGWRIIRLP